MIRLPRTALALAILALLAPTASAQTPEAPDPQETGSTVAPCSEPVDQCFPDLLPTNPRAHTTDERFPTKLCTDFLNAGRGPTVAAFRVLLLVDGVAVADQAFSDAYQSGQGERDVCWGDLQIPAGRHIMQVNVDSEGQVIESDERNNARAIAFTVAVEPRVDLMIGSFVVTPRDGKPNQNQIFSVTVTNAGTLASAPSTVEIVDTNGLLGNFTIVPLAPGAEQTVAVATRPDLRPPGSFVARAFVDPLGNNSEISEINNDAVLEYTVPEHPMTDLTITNVSLLGSRTEYRGLLVNVTVENIGDKFVRGALVRVFNETDVALAEGSTNIYLRPNATTTIQMRLVVHAGNRTFSVKVDPLNTVLERNESNNAQVFDVAIVPPSLAEEKPNLVVERIYLLPSDPAPNEPMSFGALVRNVGTNRSVATMLNFSVDGRPIGSTPIPALPVDTTFTGYVGWISNASGAHSISVFADGSSKVVELDEGDNALSQEFLLDAPIPEEEPEPETPPPVVTPPPTNTTKPPVVTPPANTTKPPTNATGPRLAFGDLLLEPRAVPGGVKGVISVTLRNTRLDPLGLVTVAFKVDGVLLTEVLVPSIPGAATRPATSGEVDLPSGAHKVTAEVRIVGSSEPTLVREKEYDVEAGEKEGVPGVPPLLVALAAVALALSRRRKLT